MVDGVGNISIRNTINIKDFAAIQNELASLVDFSVVTVDAEGTPIGALSNFTSFCQYIRSSPAGRMSCEECDRKSSLEALRVGKPLIYECHCGLKDCTAPIVVAGVHIGGVLGGQVFVQEEDRAKVDTAKIAKKCGLSIEHLETLLVEIKVVSEDYLHRCLRFYSFMANYFAETGLKELIEEKMAAERQKLLQLQNISREQEIKRMQAQMNPHFLFNALNSIARIALLEDAERTENLIYHLSNYLRYSIKNPEATPKLTQELEHLQHYLSIQKTRFDDRIHFTVAMDPELLDCCIPSMTLQPIVENSINHGLENRKEGGLIDICGKCSKDGHDMLITVRDNGDGFSPQILSMFNAGGQVESSTQLGLGLMNTHERIKHTYGNEYGLTIESVPGEYSCVTIRIPKRFWGTDV